MKYAFAQMAFGLGANALVARDAAQCIQLKASGGVSGTLGQLYDGQNRIGGNYPSGCYCLSNGGFTDSKGRGCILTKPTTQFQCDVGATPSTGFAIGSNGGVTSNGSGKFYACPATDTGIYNVYTTPAPGQTKCVEISLSSGGTCGAAAQSSMPAPKSSMPAPSPPASSAPVPAPSSPAPKPAPSSPAPAPAPSSPAPKPAPSSPAPAPPASSMMAPSPPVCVPTTVTVTVTMTKPVVTPSPAPPAPAPSSPAPPAPSPSKAAPPAPASSMAAPPAKASSMAAPPAPAPSMASGQCPADLNGNYQYPHLIVPVSSSSPSSAMGTSYNGKVDKSTCSIFNFDIPASYSGKKCSVLFLFPAQKDLTTSSYTVSGSGQCSFSQLSKPADQSTSWSNKPSMMSAMASMSIAPGNSYVIASGACAAGQTVSYQMCSSGDFSLNYFQDYNPSPIGMYVRQC